MSIKDKLQALLKESETIQLVEGEDLHEALDESWDKGSGFSAGDSINAIKYRKLAARDLKDSKDFEEDYPEHSECMARYHSNMAKHIKHAYHAGEYGVRSEAEPEHDKHLKLAKEFNLKSKDMDESIESDISNYSLEQLDESLIFASGHVEDDLDNYNNELKQHGIKLHSKDAGDTSIISVRKNNKSIGVFPHDYKDTAEDFANELHSITKNHGVHVKSRPIDGGDVVRISKPIKESNESLEIEKELNMSIKDKLQASLKESETIKLVEAEDKQIHTHKLFSYNDDGKAVDAAKAAGINASWKNDVLTLKHHDKELLKKHIKANTDYTDDEIEKTNVLHPKHEIPYYGNFNESAKAKLQKETTDMTEDMDALFNGETLTEEFKEKATTIFEAAVISRVKDEVQELDEIYSTQVQALKEQSEETIETLKEEFAQKLDEQVEEVKASLVEHVDGFLNYIVEQWMNDNEVALETGIKNEIAENVVTGLHKLFSENFVQVPEDKTDLVSEMELHLETVIDKLDEQIKANIELTKTINESKRETMIEKFSQGLTDLNAEKFKSLVEELSFDSAEKFQVKLETIKENYFTKKTVKESTKTNVMITDEPVLELNEDVTPKQTPVMSAYLKQFSK